MDSWRGPVRESLSIDTDVDFDLQGSKRPRLATGDSMQERRPPIPPPKPKEWTLPMRMLPKPSFIQAHEVRRKLCVSPALAEVLSQDLERLSTVDA